MKLKIGEKIYDSEKDSEAIIIKLVEKIEYLEMNAGHTEFIHQENDTHLLENRVTELEEQIQEIGSVQE